jgi:RNA polymerase sigma factor (sigma-70 family)
MTDPRFTPELVSMVNGIARKKSKPHLREDSVSVALVATLEALERYVGRDDATLETYVSAVVSGAVRDYCIFRERHLPRSGNSLTREHERENPEIGVDHVQAYLVGRDQHESDADAEKRARVEKLIERLSEREAKIIWYRYYDDLSLKEVSALLGISIQRVGEIERRSILKMGKP